MWIFWSGYACHFKGFFPNIFWFACTWPCLFHLEKCLLWGSSWSPAQQVHSPEEAQIWENAYLHWCAFIQAIPKKDWERLCREPAVAQQKTLAKNCHQVAKPCWVIKLWFRRVNKHNDFEVTGDTEKKITCNVPGLAEPKRKDAFHENFIRSEIFHLCLLQLFGEACNADWKWKVMQLTSCSFPKGRGARLQKGWHSVNALAKSTQGFCWCVCTRLSSPAPCAFQ